MARDRLLFCLLLGTALGCGGRVTVYELVAAGGASVAGGSPGVAGALFTGSAGSNVGGTTVGVAGAASLGGAIGVGGAIGLAGAGGQVATAGVAGQIQCITSADCPPPPNACIVGGCVSGACTFSFSDPGKTFIVPDEPPDCHATVACDGRGNGIVIVDQQNVPSPQNPCLQGTCNAAGVPGTESAPAGLACKSENGGVRCDGEGSCVECLHTSECSVGQSCSAEHACVAAPCTDVDCGGVCPACDLGKKCLSNLDCASNACDAVSHVCIADPCVDHHQDWEESDADCGGGVCKGCPLGKGCGLDLDCASVACDGVSLVCVSNQCADHRQDGLETDVDCGGGICKLCAKNKKCKSNFDCELGCSVTVPHLCQ